MLQGLRSAQGTNEAQSFATSFIKTLHLQADQEILENKPEKCVKAPYASRFCKEYID